jgi:polysaccharide deacetylase 2 family uncharacterized protein YibQ
LLKTKGKPKKYQIIVAVIVIVFLIILLKKMPPKIKKKIPTEQPKIEKLKPIEEKKKEYRIAVIIDDVGYPSDILHEYQNFNGKLTFSVLPFLKLSAKYAEILHEKGFEIMIHIPMEPQAYPKTNPGPYALLTDNTKEEIEQKLSMMIKNNPFAVGANNHMGSHATTDRHLMLWTLGLLKDRDLFFIDSVTTPDSLAHEIALNLNIETSQRDVFLDNEDSFSAINGQFEKLKKIARTNGTAIGIGHINKQNTLKVLVHQLPLLKEENYTLIFASETVVHK